MSDEEFYNNGLPGVTRILSDIFGQDEFKNIPELILKAATERGHIVHEIIEQYIINNEMPLIPLEYQIYIDYFNDWKLKYEPQFIFSEKRLVSKKYGFKGIIDTLFFEEYNEELVMCDWKTSSSLNVFKAKCQLNLYLLLLEEDCPEYVDKIKKLKILSLTKSGYTYYEFKPDKELAFALLKIYKEKHAD